MKGKLRQYGFAVFVGVMISMLVTMGFVGFVNPADETAPNQAEGVVPVVAAGVVAGGAAVAGFIAGYKADDYFENATVEIDDVNETLREASHDEAISTSGSNEAYLTGVDNRLNTLEGSVLQVVNNEIIQNGDNYSTQTDLNQSVENVTGDYLLGSQKNIEETHNFQSLSTKSIIEKLQKANASDDAYVSKPRLVYGDSGNSQFSVADVDGGNKENITHTPKGDFVQIREDVILTGGSNGNYLKYDLENDTAITGVYGDTGNNDTEGIGVLNNGDVVTATYYEVRIYNGTNLSDVRIVKDISGNRELSVSGNEAYYYNGTTTVKVNATGTVTNVPNLSVEEFEFDDSGRYIAFQSSTNYGIYDTETDTKVWTNEMGSNVIDVTVVDKTGDVLATSGANVEVADLSNGSVSANVTVYSGTESIREISKADANGNVYLAIDNTRVDRFNVPSGTDEGTVVSDSASLISVFDSYETDVTLDPQDVSSANLDAEASFEYNNSTVNLTAINYTMATSYANDDNLTIAMPYVNVSGSYEPINYGNNSKLVVNTATSGTIDTVEPVNFSRTYNLIDTRDARSDSAFTFAQNHADSLWTSELEPIVTNDSKSIYDEPNVTKDLSLFDVGTLDDSDDVLSLYAGIYPSVNNPANDRLNITHDGVSYNKVVLFSTDMVALESTGDNDSEIEVNETLDGTVPERTFIVDPATGDVIEMDGNIKVDDVIDYDDANATVLGIQDFAFESLDLSEKAVKLNKSVEVTKEVVITAGSGGGGVFGFLPSLGDPFNIPDEVVYIVIGGVVIGLVRRD